MAHYVNCKYCDTKFDRDKKSYVELGKHYAHAECYLRECVANPLLPTLEIHDPTDIVICCYCKKSFNKTKIPFVAVGKKYAHIACAELEALRPKTEQEKLDDYICNLFDVMYVPPRIRKQINQYVSEYGYSYSGIRKSLEYFYDIKKNSIEKAHDSIGIVPYIYKEAYKYWETIFNANNANDQKDINSYVPKKEQVIIPVPEVKEMRKKSFSFLDLDEVEDGE